MPHHRSTQHDNTSQHSTAHSTATHTNTMADESKDEVFPLVTDELLTYLEQHAKVTAVQETKWYKAAHRCGDINKFRALDTEEQVAIINELWEEQYWSQSFSKHQLMVAFGLQTARGTGPPFHSLVLTKYDYNTSQDARNALKSANPETLKMVRAISTTLVGSSCERVVDYKTDQLRARAIAVLTEMKTHLADLVQDAEAGADSDSQ